MTFPFELILVATMIKEGAEDYSRYLQDKINNNQNVLKLNNGEWENSLSYNLLPGDIIKIRKEEECTTDLLILKSSNPYEFFYVDTKSLDGETHLIQKNLIIV